MTATDAFALFDGRARATLRELGRPATARAICAIVGANTSHYSRCMHGHLGSWDTLVSWLGRWREAGLPSLGLLREVADDVEGERVSPPPILTPQAIARTYR